MSLSTRQLRNAWGPACSTSRLVKLPLYGSGWVSVDNRITGAVAWLNESLKHFDYRTRQGDTGAFNCRKITGGSGYSLHAFAIALDINWLSNPYGKSLKTDMPRAMVNEIESYRTNNGKRVWEWGGGWSGNKDAMHYEVDCTPADLATGIRGGTAPAGGGADWNAIHTYVQGLRDSMGGQPTITRDSEALRIILLQQVLTVGPGSKLATDGQWGPATDEAVKNFQKFMGLTPDGIVGDTTRFYLCLALDKILKG